MKPNSFPLMLFALLTYFAPTLGVKAVVPPPDGGYPGFNTAEGTKALQGLATGSANTAVGWYSLFSNATGSFNTATGAGSLLFNTGDANAAFGAAALLFNAGGTNNTAVGAAALLNNTTGTDNTATGDNALLNNTDGIQNTATGSVALFSNTTGQQNTSVGFQALYENTVGGVNTALGSGALFNNTTGVENVAIGYGALSHNIGGNSNIAVGANAGKFVTNANSVIVIGAPGANVSGSCFIGNIFGVTPGGATPVVIDSQGQLGTMSSSVRFKNDITMMGNASEAILSLEPVTFYYKSDQTRTPQFGLIAEEVAKINPDLVIRDAKGELYTVRYDAVNAMLLNEFLKEHRTVQALTSTVAKQEAIIAKQQMDFHATAAHQQKQIEALTAGLQRVSAQLELSKPEPQVVLKSQ